jgi:hypothetical protein
VSIQVICQNCQTTLKTSDSSAGKRAKCPKCGGIIDIPASPSAPVESDEYELEPPTASPQRSFSDDELAAGSTPAGDRKPCPACGEQIAAKAIKCRFCGEVFDRSLRGIASGGRDVHDPGWQKVRNGLGILYYSIVAMFASLVVIMIGGMLLGGTAVDDNEKPPIAFIVLIGIGGLVIFAAAIGTLVGQVKCSSVPAESGAKGLATGAALCIVGNVALSMIGGASEIPALNLLGSLLSLIGYLLFILFIRRAAASLSNFDLADSAGHFLMFGVAAFVFGIGLGVVGAIAQLPVLLGLLGLGLFVVGIVTFVWYLRLIKGLMTTIDERMSVQ